MRLIEAYFKNFRSYENEVRISFGEITTIIGKNDIGKSTILEALEIFFNNDTVKIDSADPCVGSQSKEVEIGCIFSDFPDEIILDSTAKTSLEREFLLNERGFLEIVKTYNCAPKTIKPVISLVAHHPSVDGANDLLSLKIADLKKRAERLKIDGTSVDFGIKAQIRKAIWSSFTDLECEISRIELDKEDGAEIWKKIESSLPGFALFKSDRASKDDDSEVQDPMKIAIKQAIKTLEAQLASVKEAVHNRVLDVANRTVEKLKEMDPALAGQLNPNFKAEPKWEGLFSLSLTGEDQIPINKRGSGVRRLILLNFFRAEAERRIRERSASNFIYAIEEPETSQHPDNQRMLAGALMELPQSGSCQVVLTTHIPGFAGLLPKESIRYVNPRGSTNRILVPQTEQHFEEIASNLGVFPDHKIKTLLFVEGPNDVSFLKEFSKKASRTNQQLLNLDDDPRVAFVPLGGSNLKQWVEKGYLRGIRRPEFYIYDRDNFENPPYQEQCDDVNRRGDGSYAAMVARLELENYIPRSAINRVLEIDVENYDYERTDVPSLVAKKIHEKGGGGDWDQLSAEKKKKKISQAKFRLNSEVMSSADFKEFIDENCHTELLEILEKIRELADS